MNRYIAFIILILLAIPSLYAIDDNIDSLNQKAVKAYQDKEYQTALSDFIRIEKQGVIDANLFYNMGNCYFRLEQLGMSILYYKKALKVNPTHSLAKKNLDFAFTLTRDKIESSDSGALEKILKNLYHSFSLNTLALISIILFALLVLLLIIMQTLYRFKDKSLPVFFIFLIIIFLAATVIITSMKYSAYHKNSDAVIIALTAVGFSGPGAEYTRVFTIHEGMTCNIEDKNENWVLIKLPNGIGGWIESNLLKRVSL